MLRRSVKSHERDMETGMPLNLASEMKKALGVDVIRRDAVLVEKLATSLAPKLFKEMMPTIASRDIGAFSEQIRAALDEPGFDEAFAGVLNEAWTRGFLGSQECDMLFSVAKNLAAECNVVRKRGDTEVFVMFAVPVQGEPSALDALFNGGAGAEMLAEIVKQSGFVQEGADVAFLPALFNPGDLSEAAPSDIRYAASTIGLSMFAEDREASFKRSGKTVGRRINADQPLHAWHDEPTGSDIRVLLGGYIQKGLMNDLRVDGLLMSVGKFDDAPGYLAARQSEFMDRASSSLGVVFGPPSTVPRVVSDLAFASMATSLLNSAGYQGFVSVDDPRLDPDDLVFFVEDEAVVVLAKFGGGVANSDPIPYHMVAGDFDHFVERLRAIHPAARMLPQDKDDPTSDTGHGLR
jgi:hypothetical protein